MRADLIEHLQCDLLHYVAFLWMTYFPNKFTEGLKRAGKNFGLALKKTKFISV
jgi:hypothetical protein